MPIIDKVAEKYKDQGVELFAVNMQEEPDEIEPFLEESRCSTCPWRSTREGEDGPGLHGQAIPQTVIVGKDGTVQVVKIGLSPDLAASLSKELESLIEGKDLAAETLAKAKRRPTTKKPAAEAEAEADKKAKDSESDK